MSVDLFVTDGLRRWTEAWAQQFPSPACPPARGAPWCVARDGNMFALLLHRRHYSRRAGQRSARLVLGPGEKMVLVTPDGLAAFGWRKHHDRSGQRGVCAAFFRSETLRWQSSDLIRAAVAAARQRWPHERFYTFVNPRKIRGSNPGCCFRKGGWQRCGTTRGGLLIFELASSPTLDE